MGAVVIGLAGTVLLAIAGLNAPWMQGWLWLPGLFGYVVTGIVFVILGGIIGPVAAEISHSRREGELHLALKTTLVPTAASLLKEAASKPDSEQVRRMLTGVMKDLRAYVGSNGTDADANLYYLQTAPAGHNPHSLVRLNDSDTKARRTFQKTKARNEAAVEASAVVDRILNQEQVFCPDVKKEKNQEKYNLDPERKRNYRAFMSVPILSGDKPLGMLSVNANKTGVIRPYHFEYLDIVATLIGEFHSVYPLRQLLGQDRGQEDAHE